MDDYKVIIDKVQGSNPRILLDLHRVKIGEKEVCSFYSKEAAYSIAGKLNRGEPVTDTSGFKWSYKQLKWVMSE